MLNLTRYWFFFCCISLVFLSLHLTYYAINWGETGGPCRGQHSLSHTHSHTYTYIHTPSGGRAVLAANWLIRARARTRDAKGMRARWESQHQPLSLSLSLLRRSRAINHGHTISQRASERERERAKAARARALAAPNNCIFRFITCYAAAYA